MFPCIEWAGAHNGLGYGTRRLPGTRVRVYVHRWIWEIAHGPIPEGGVICHRCDNPRCYNLDHLFLGTRRDNMQDMLAKGRQGWQVRTHCDQGHKLVMSANGGGQRARRCPTCRNRRKQERKLRIPGGDYP